MNKVMFTVLAVMFSQSVMAMSNEAPQSGLIDLVKVAKAQGYAVAHCTYGQCRSTDDGNYVSISNVSKDGYYVYDPRSADAPEKFDLTKP